MRQHTLSSSHDGRRFHSCAKSPARALSSHCLGPPRNKLVLEGKCDLRDGRGRGPLTYTLRTGVSVRRAGELGLAQEGRAQDRSDLDESSVLWWENPELCVSLGEKGLMGLLPKVRAHALC